MGPERLEELSHLTLLQRRQGVVCVINPSLEADDDPVVI